MSNGCNSLQSNMNNSLIHSGSPSSVLHGNHMKFSSKDTQPESSNSNMNEQMAKSSYPSGSSDSNVAMNRGCASDNIRPTFVGLTSDRGSPILGIDMASANALISEALCKFNNLQEQNSFPEDSKLLANPKGIIKSFLAQAEATDPGKFDAYRKLCTAHIKEFYNHQKGGIGATCLICNAVCQHWNTLQRHLQTHVDFRPFTCETCGRTFYSQSKLKRHVVIHNEVKPYKCPVCDRRLGRTEHLKRHLLVHTDNKPFGCSGCTHTTKRLDGIRRHIKRKHGPGGAEIITLTSQIESQTMESLRVVMSSVEAASAATSQDNKPLKKPKKKKKKKNAAAASMSEDLLAYDSKEADCGNLSAVAACFGVRDLRMPGLESGRASEDGNHQKDMKYFQGQGGQRTTEHMQDEDKPSWEQRPGIMLPTQLIYQSLARAHPTPPHHLGDSSRNQVALNKPPTTAATPLSFQSNHTNVLTQPNNAAFVMNSSDSSVRYPTTAADGVTAARNAAPMLLSPGCSGGNIGRYNQVDMAGMGSLPTEMMISQYFQSHQRFAPPVWGFAANPTYPNY